MFEKPFETPHQMRFMRIIRFFQVIDTVSYVFKMFYTKAGTKVTTLWASCVALVLLVAFYPKNKTKML